MADSLLQRCLALTASIETGKAPPQCFAQVAGNFDGQGVSFGALQWNFGQKTLQPLLLELYDSSPDLMASTFGADSETFHSLLQGPQSALMSFFVSMQSDPDKDTWRLWSSRFTQLGLTSECAAAEGRHAQGIYNRALELCHEYGLNSERAVALMFDICIQNGSIGSATRDLILADFENATTEPEKLVIIANRRAEAASSKWVEDVRARKLCIANGSGKIHGQTYDLAGQFGITLDDAADLYGPLQNAA